jgi:transposase-like protein
MSRKLNQYSSEFKESAIKLALEGDKSIGQTSVDLGIKKHPLYLDSQIWRRPRPLSLKPMIMSLFMMRTSA